MHDGAERIDLLTLDENIDLHQIGGLFAVLMVVERRIALVRLFNWSKKSNTISANGMR